MENTIVFGEYQNLVGTFCEPDLVEPSPLAVLMLTPGMLHHVGPMRMHVQLARRLANSGISSLRYDLSGIGESLAVGLSGTSLERATCEAKAAMDWLQDKCGIERFALFGLCSGADDALAIAQKDDRVVGISMLDGLGYRTKPFYLHWLKQKYLPKAISVTKWGSYLRGLMKSDSVSATSMPMGQDIREFPSRPEAEQQLQSLLQRSVRFQLIYTGGAVDYYSYRDQFYDMFPSIGHHENIQLMHFPTMDHLASLRSDRDRLLDELHRWLCNLSDDVAVQQLTRSHERNLATAF